MKKKILIFAMLAAMVVMSLAGCGGNGDNAQLIAELQVQIDELNARVEALEMRSGLKSWNLTAAAWSSSNGATVTLTAQPAAYREGQSMEFMALLDGAQADSVSCSWDGESYTAQLDLNAADGYGYYCVITAPDGTREQVALSTPENPVIDTVVNLSTALSSYCNMIVDTWGCSGDQLTITAGYVQVQLPRIARDGGNPTISTAELVLKKAGEELSRQALTIPEGEGENSYELVLSDSSFSVPEMQDDQQLDLYLEVILSDGQVLSTAGCSWYYNAGELFLAVG